MSIKTLAKSLSFRAFLAFDRVGLHVLPKHYYTPVADRAWLRSHREMWQRPLAIEKLTYWNLDEQLTWVEALCSPYGDETRGELGEGIGPGYGPIEAQLLYCFVRARSPARIVEVGGGTSTVIMSRAAERNVSEGRTATDITVIDPHPAPELAGLPTTQVVRSGCQELDPGFFVEHLRAGDLLFIDSSHVVKTGSELAHLYLSVIPALPAGVVIHIHDIFLPYLYRPTVLHDYFDWQETALLAALLTGNDRLRPLCCGSALHYNRADEIVSILPDYRPANVQGGLIVGTEFTNGHFPAVFWMETRE